MYQLWSRMIDVTEKCKFSWDTVKIYGWILLQFLLSRQGQEKVYAKLGGLWKVYAKPGQNVYETSKKLMIWQHAVYVPHPKDNFNFVRSGVATFQWKSMSELHANFGIILSWLWLQMLLSITVIITLKWCVRWWYFIKSNTSACSGTISVLHLSQPTHCSAASLGCVGNPTHRTFSSNSGKF